MSGAGPRCCPRADRRPRPTAATSGSSSSSRVSGGASARNARRVLHADRGGRREGRSPAPRLLLSQEPYVPWELAAVEPALDPHGRRHARVPRRAGRCRPLGLRAAAARAAAAGRGGRAVDRRREWRVSRGSVATRQHGGRGGGTRAAIPRVAGNARSASVIDCLKGHPPADVLHFAVHGTYAPKACSKDCAHRRRTARSDGRQGLRSHVRRSCSSTRVRSAAGTRYSATTRAWPRRSCMRRGRGRRAPVVDRRRGGQGARIALLPAGLRRRRDAGLRGREERGVYAGPGSDGTATRLAYRYFGHPGLSLRN